MESTTLQNRGEVAPTFAEVVEDLQIHFPKYYLLKYFDKIHRYYCLMVLVEELEYQKWRIERGHQTWEGKIEKGKII
jgi:hypothetical protein